MKPYEINTTYLSDDSMINEMKNIRVSHKYFVGCVYGQYCQTEQDLLVSIFSTLHLPEGLQHGLGGLRFWLRATVGWVPSEGYVLVIQDYDRLLQNQPEIKRRFLITLQEALQEMKERPHMPPFYVILNIPPREPKPVAGLHEAQMSSEELYTYVWYLRHYDNYLAAQILTNRCPTEDELYRELSCALQFPYFGYNWDAVSDCLRDLGWYKFQGVAIIFDDMPQLLRDEPQALPTLLRILGRAVESWDEKWVPFCVILNTLKPSERKDTQQHLLLL